ncbi:MAG: hypothetical protein GYA52_04985 [Chloroflexi bacterium]|nr:hypothetical protein [Chloroflexota bacterium]
MNLPIIWIIIPALLAAGSLLMREKRAWYVMALSVLCLILGISAFVLSFQHSVTTDLTSQETLLILGRSLTVSYQDLPLVGSIYLLAFFWIISLNFYESNDYLPAFCVIYAVLNIASFSIDPFLYSALIIFLANALYLPVLSTDSFIKISGRLRFLLYQLISIFLILLAGWILAGGEIAPVESDQLFFSTLLLGFGISIWLGVFPFHTWIPLLSDEVAFLPFGYMLTLLPLSGILLLLKFLNNFAWLREYNAFFPALQYLGAVMVILGGLGAFFQKSLPRLLAFLMMTGIGLLLTSVGFIPVASTDLVAVWIIPFFAGNWALSFGFSGLGKGAGIRSIEGLRGAFYDRPLSSVLLLVGLLTLIGFPLTAGYASNLSILSVTWNANRLIAITILISQILILATGVRLLLRMAIREGKRITIPEKVNLKQALILVVLLIDLIPGIFPSIIYNQLFAIIGRIFPLL